MKGQIGTTAAVAVSLIAATAFVGIVLTAATVHDSVPWTRVDWGSAPAWLTFIASGFTLAGVYLAYRSLEANLRNRRDDEASLARLLQLGYSATRPDDVPNEDRVTLTIELTNRSQTPFTQINIEGVAYGNHGCQQTTHEWMRDVREPSRRCLDPGQKFTSVWVVPDPYVALDNSPVTVRYHYADGSGRVWRRYSWTEPERIHARRHNREDVAAYEAAMSARKPDGGRVLHRNLWTKQARSGD